ncbi:MAG: hypothetical protein ACN4GM_00820 [Gammaproteobacteria bacterium]
MTSNNQQSGTALLKYLSYLMVAISLFGTAVVNAGDREDAARMYARLAGAIPDNAMLDQIESRMSDPVAAALYIIDNTPSFYNVTLKNFAAPWTNEAQDIFVPLNDYTATVIGMIRDGMDFRQVLSADIIYRATSATGVSGYSNFNNNHYQELEALGPVDGDLSNNSVLEQAPQSSVSNLDSSATAGVMTTRAAAAAFFSGGTNRAMLRFTLMNHLCTDLEPLKDISRVPDRVRRDVSRSPGGDSRIFMNNCVGCHAGMDGLAGAFAHYEYNEATGALEYQAGNANFDQNAVSIKHNINPNNFKYGFVTINDSWINYWRNGPNKLLGWNNSSAGFDDKGHSTGTGARSLGVELAHTRAFSTCQVKKVFKAVCLRDADVFAADRNELNGIANAFEIDGNMKNVFASVAAHCRTPQ